MIKQIEQVKEFHLAFNVPLETNPSLPSEQIQELRKTLITEETKEVTDEINNEDLVNLTKELCDLLYVTYGTILAYGLENVIEECFDEVHRSNMSKLDVCPEAINEDGSCNAKFCLVFHRKPIYREDGKVMKSKVYSQANLKPIIET